MLLAQMADVKSAMQQQNQNFMDTSEKEVRIIRRKAHSFNDQNENVPASNLVRWIPNMSISALQMRYLFRNLLETVHSACRYRVTNFETNMRSVADAEGDVAIGLTELYLHNLPPAYIFLGNKKFESSLLQEKEYGKFTRISN
jgi:hypothetical protein